MGKDYNSLINWLRANLQPREGTIVFAKTGTRINDNIYYDYDLLYCTKDDIGAVYIFSPEQDTYLPNMKKDFLVFWALPEYIEDLVLSCFD